MVEYLGWDEMVAKFSEPDKEYAKRFSRVEPTPSEMYKHNGYTVTEQEDETN